MEEQHPTPFLVKSQSKKPKPTWKISQVPLPNSKVSHLQRQKRVFGTTRNQNVPTSNPKPASEKPKPKPKFTKKSTAPSQKTPPPQANHEDPKTSNDKTTMINALKQRKSVSFQDIEGERSEKSNATSEFPRTPVKSPSFVANKLRSRSSTPYLSAGTCSKCRYDRLETSAYWIGQIKLAEAVGKHFVSSSFFRLAFQCKAEPLHNIRVELKKYLARHDYLNEEEEWKRLSIMHGLVKENSYDNEINAKATRNVCAHEGEDDLQKQVTEES